MKRFWRCLSNMRRETGVGLSGLVLGLSIACVLAHFPGSSTEWATWAQAIGTVVVFIGAIWTAYYQVEHARKSTEQRELETALRTYQLLQSIHLRLYSDTQALAFHLSGDREQDDHKVRCRRRDAFRHIYQALCELPVHTLPDFDSVSCLLDSRQLSEEVLEQANEYAKQGSMFTDVQRNPEPWKKFHERAEEIWLTLSESIKRLKYGI